MDIKVTSNNIIGRFSGFSIFVFLNRFCGKKQQKKQQKYQSLSNKN